MRIAVDARELQGKPTGVGRFLSEVLGAWTSLPEARAHDIVLLTPEGPDRGTLWEQFDLPKRARDARADVLFCPAYTAPLRPGMPLVVAVHDVSFAAHPEWFSWREGARRRTLSRLAARAAARVITISEFSRREIAAYLGVDRSKIAVAYPGVSSFADGRTPTTGPSSILFVGSIFNRRHVPELIEGFAHLARNGPDVRLEIVGDNRTSPKILLEPTAVAAGVADRVHIRSYVSDDELRHLYAEGAAFVFLSEYEGFGLTPLEALAAGIPVLLLDTDVAREVFADAAMYVKRPDPPLIARALETLLFDIQERQRLAAARARVLGRYSWIECARRVLAVLTETVHA